MMSIGHLLQAGPGSRFKGACTCHLIVPKQHPLGANVSFVAGISELSFKGISGFVECTLKTAVIGTSSCPPTNSLWCISPRGLVAGACARHSSHHSPSFALAFMALRALRNALARLAGNLLVPAFQIQANRSGDIPGVPRRSNVLMADNAA
jgi:hypothetical protein